MRPQAVAYIVRQQAVNLVQNLTFNSDLSALVIDKGGKSSAGPDDLYRDVLGYLKIHLNIHMFMWARRN